MNQPSPMRVTYMVTVGDAERAQAFYRDALKADVVWAAPDGTWTVLDIGGTELCLHGNGTTASKDTGLAVEVEDLEQTCHAVERAGGRAYRPEEWTSPDGEVFDPPEWLAIVTDTEGNRFCVVRRGGCFLHPSLFPDRAAQPAS